MFRVLGLESFGMADLGFLGVRASRLRVGGPPVVPSGAQGSLRGLRLQQLKMRPETWRPLAWPLGL